MHSRSIWKQGSTRSLFERICGAEAEPAPQDETALLIESVKHQLDQILNTRPGSCLSAPALGVADFNNAISGIRDLQGQIRSAIRQCICQFEPRIVQVDVCSPDQSSSSLDMVFHVTAHLRFAHIEQVTAFNLQIDNQRRYRMV